MLIRLSQRCSFFFVSSSPSIAVASAAWAACCPLFAFSDSSRNVAFWDCSDLTSLFIRVMVSLTCLINDCHESLIFSVVCQPLLLDCCVGNAPVIDSAACMYQLVVSGGTVESCTTYKWCYTSMTHLRSCMRVLCCCRFSAAEAVAAFLTKAQAACG